MVPITYNPNIKSKTEKNTKYRFQEALQNKHFQENEDRL
jgi:hypothetical protein